MYCLELYKKRMCDADPMKKNTISCLVVGARTLRRVSIPARKKRSPILLQGLIGLLMMSAAHAGFNLGDSSNYQILYTGAGKKLEFQDSSILGNIGIGALGGGVFNPDSKVDGNIDFAAEAIIESKGAAITGEVRAKQAAVQNNLDYLSELSSNLGAEKGTETKINLPKGEMTINADTGVPDKDGNRIFHVVDFEFNNSSTLFINGDGKESVVFNFAKGAEFSGRIVLKGGLEADQVLWNLHGSEHELKVNTSQNTLQGVFLNPKGKMSMNNSILRGRFFGGGAEDMSIDGRSLIHGSDPIPEPSTYALLGIGAIGMLMVMLRKKTG
jgi:choice-of-anchor A domain-containing protein